MRTIHITTMHETFVIDDRNRFSRPATGMPFTDDWLLVGAVSFKEVFGRSHETWYTVDDIINGKVPWFYKNGKQKSYIVHNDYGTIAAQMMPPLKSVKIVNF